MENIFNEIYKNQNHQWIDREGEKEYVWDRDAEKIIKSIENVEYIDTYGMGSYNGFYIKKGNTTLTVYCRKNESNSGFSLDITIINLDKRVKTQIGGGYGTSGVDFTTENYNVNLQGLRAYKESKIVSMLNEMITIFKQL